jgi:serine/threonine-protein kinase
MAIGETSLCIGCMKPMAGDGICPLCGYDNTQPNAQGTLQPGTVIAGRYAVGALQSMNSEGVTYIGYDGERDHPVWIREYFPAAIASRDTQSGLVTPLHGCGAQYKALMSDMVDLCNAVKRLSVSDAVVPIEGVLSDNNTLYAIYKQLDIIPLEEHLALVGGKIPVKNAIRMFQPLCDTMSNMHARGDLHRGISPQTVYIDRDEKLYLWGFSQAATRTGGSELAAELYNGYAAPEQYASNGWQGPWTDVFAMAALFYRTVSGIVPPKSTMVGAQRMVAPLIDLVDDIPPSISEAVADAMGIAAGDRTQTMAGFSSQLILLSDVADTATTAVYDLVKVTRGRDKSGTKAKETRRVKDSESGVSAKYILLALLCTVLLLGGILWYVTTTFFPELAEGRQQSSRPSSVVSTEQSSTPSSSEESSEEEDKTVPQFVGRQYDQVVADESLAARFQFEKQEEYNDNYPAGEIYNQTPVEGTLMANKGIVILYVSKGKRILIMPDLSGLTLEEAEEEILKLEEENDGEIDLILNPIDRYDEGTEPGQIISTMPLAGEEFNPKDTTIFVYVSLAPDVSETTEESSRPRSGNYD